LVEFALALPLLLFLAMAIADFGRILLVYAELGGGVREALRYAIVQAPTGSMTKAQWSSFCYGDLLDRLKATLVLTPKQALVPQRTYFVYFESFRYDTGQFQPAVECASVDRKFVLKREDRVVIDAQVTVSPVTPMIQALLPQVTIRYRAGRTCSRRTGCISARAGCRAHKKEGIHGARTLRSNAGAGGADADGPDRAGGPGHRWQPGLCPATAGSERRGRRGAGRDAGVVVRPAWGRR
jgi:hypothetical protein